MIYEFYTEDGKKPDPDVVPTRVSVAGREYEVKDYCIEAPVKVEDDLRNLGFRPRRPSRVVVQDTARADVVHEDLKRHDELKKQEEIKRSTLGVQAPGVGGSKTPGVPGGKEHGGE